MQFDFSKIDMSDSSSLYMVENIYSDLESLVLDISDLSKQDVKKKLVGIMQDIEGYFNPSDADCGDSSEDEDNAFSM